MRKSEVHSFPRRRPTARTDMRRVRRLSCGLLQAARRRIPAMVAVRQPTTATHVPPAAPESAALCCGRTNQ